jgi:5S rRNA maturation endonuclease (ribonuclease M5)
MAKIKNMEHLIEVLDERDWHYHDTGRGIRTVCPFHGGESLDLKEGHTRPIVATCWGGCDRIGERMSELIQAFEQDDVPERACTFAESSGGPFPGTCYDLRGTKPHRQKADRVHVYEDADGHPLARRLVWVNPETGDKTARWEEKVEGEKATWTDGLAESRGKLPLYHLPQLARADADLTVIYVEGEKDADRGRAEVFLDPVFTTAGSVNDWRADHAESLRDRHVVVIPDLDEPGLKLADRVIADLAGVAASVKLIRLDFSHVLGQDAPQKDLSDWLDSGKEIGELLELVEATSAIGEEKDWIERDEVLQTLKDIEQCQAKDVAKIKSLFQSLPPLPDQSSDKLGYELAVTRIWASFKEARLPKLLCTTLIGNHACIKPPSKMARQETEETAPPIPMPAIAKEQDILDRFSDLVSKTLVGEHLNARLIYLALTSRVLDEPYRPVSVVVKGESSGGKSFTVKQVLHFFPKSVAWVRTGISPKALVYANDSFQHRFVILYEADSIQGEDAGTAAEFCRTLLSEGRIEWETVIDQKSVTISKAGPTGLITTTTMNSLHPENETRMFSAYVEDSPEQTKSIVMRIAQGILPQEDMSEWHQLQQWIGQQDCRTHIPFAETLARLVWELPHLPVRMRRDFGAILSLVAASAVLHQATRDRDENGRIVATEADYDVVREVVGHLAAESAGMAVGKDVAEVLDAVGTVIARKSEAKESPHATISETALEMGCHRDTAKKRLAKAHQAGYVKNIEPRRNQPALYVIEENPPEPVTALPPLPIGWDQRNDGE